MKNRNYYHNHDPTLVKSLLLKIVQFSVQNTPAELNCRFFLTWVTHFTLLKSVIIENASMTLLSNAEGNVPLWEAILEKHESVIRLLTDNGAKLSAGDVGQFACVAAEKNDLDLLKQIIRYGGDVTRPRSNGTTALHIAVCEGNTKIVKFLLDQGADIDRVDEHGWTSRDLAEQLGHEEIKSLFESIKDSKTQPNVTIPEERHGVRFLGRFKSEASSFPVNQDGSFPLPEGSWGQSRPRRKTNNFHNSLFGIMSAVRNGDNDWVSSVIPASAIPTTQNYAARVTISCPEKGDNAGKLILLPQSFQELLEIGRAKYGFLPARVLIKDGAEVDNIELIRDGDHLTFASDEHSHQNGFR